MGSDRRDVIRREIAVSTADNTDIARFVVPAGRIVNVYNLRYISDGQPNTGVATTVELVNSANTVQCEVNASLAILSQVAETATTMPLKLENTGTSDVIYKLRTNGLFLTPGKGTVELHIDYPDAQ